MRSLRYNAETNEFYGELPGRRRGRRARHRRRARRRRLFAAARARRRAGAADGRSGEPRPDQGDHLLPRPRNDRELPVVAMGFTRNEADERAAALCAGDVRVDRSRSGATIGGRDHRSRSHRRQSLSPKVQVSAPSPMGQTRPRSRAGQGSGLGELALSRRTPRACSLVRPTLLRRPERRFGRAMLLLPAGLLRASAIVRLPSPRSSSTSSWCSPSTRRARSTKRNGQLQMQGYAAAFRDARVQAAIISGPTDRVAVARARLGRRDGAALGERLVRARRRRPTRSASPPSWPGCRAGRTAAPASAPGSPRRSASSTATACTAPRQVVDVSGDGRETPPRETVVLMPMANAHGAGRAA